MIPWTAENKYCFDMRVSARAMGSRGRSREHPQDQIGAIGFSKFDWGLRLLPSAAR